MKIILKKSDVFAEASKLSAVAAASLQGGARFEDAWATEYEAPILDTFWAEGCTALVGIFTRYVRSTTSGHDFSDYDKDEVFTLVADMPDTFNDLLEGSITTSAMLFMAHFVLSRWFAFKSLTEPAAFCQAKVDACAADIRSKLLHRIAPAQNRSHDAASDTNEAVAPDYFSKGITDTDVDIPKDYFGKETEDTDVDIPKDYFGTGATDVSAETNQEYFAEKEEDNYKFEQYERCNHHFAQGRNNERCG